MKKYIITLFFSLPVIMPVFAFAGPMTFKFTNPSFGGNPFASNHFLTLMEAQKIPQETVAEQSAVERFQEQLQTRVLSALSSQITRQIYEGEFTSGETIIVGDITVTPTLDGDQLNLEIMQGGVLTEFSIDAPGASDIITTTQ